MRRYSAKRGGLDGGNPITEAIVTRQGGDVPPRVGEKGDGSARAVRRARPEHSEGDARRLRRRMRREFRLDFPSGGLPGWDRHGSICSPASLRAAAGRRARRLEGRLFARRRPIDFLDGGGSRLAPQCRCRHRYRRNRGGRPAYGFLTVGSIVGRPIAVNEDEIALRAAINLLHDSTKSGRMPSGKPLAPEAAALH
jgi:hypothetical protein